MKTNFKRIGKQSISIVLAVMMMLSTMLGRYGYFECSRNPC